MKSAGKSNFASLVKYLTDEQSKNERVGYVNVTNCQSTDWKVAITEALNTQAQNTRAGSDKTYHLIVSFRAGEQIDDQTLHAIEPRICDGLGFGDHQRVSAVHHDTDNLHFHIAINKIHPTRYTIHDPYNDHKTLGQLCDKLEREYGLQVDNHQAQKTGSENRAGDMERHAGVQSLLGWIKRECSDQLKEAQSWGELHSAMSRNGLALQERGNGLVITDGSGLGVKASSVARELSMTQLEKRFGAFEPATTARAQAAVVAEAGAARRVQAPRVGGVGKSPPPRGRGRLQSLSQLGAMSIDGGRRYEPAPMQSRANTVELYARYKQEQQAGSALRANEWARAFDRKNRALEAAKRTARLKRSAIKLIAEPGLTKRALYSSTAAAVRDEIQSIKKQYLADRQSTFDKYQRRAWADWLRARATEGDQEALQALRAREAARSLEGNTVAAAGGHRAPQGASQHDSVTKKGTIIYRVGSSAVRDDGDKLKVSRGADAAGLQAALQLAAERFGNRIAVNGTAAFKEEVVRAAASSRLPITFADDALERRRLELVSPTTTKESIHEHDNIRAPSQQGARTNGGRADRGRDGLSEHTAPGIDPTRARRTVGRQSDSRIERAVPAIRLAGKPDVGRIGRRPPPQGQNRLRGLSELGVVQLSGRGEVLLPSHVPGHVEQQGAQPDNGLRRPVLGAGGVSSSQQAADRYIAERETTRAKVSDIPKHTRYNHRANYAVTFAGVRQVEGHHLALLRRNEEVLVLPIDEAAVRRLKRVAVGDAVTVSPSGVIKTRGRSR